MNFDYNYLEPRAEVPIESNSWVLKRQDDHGNQYQVSTFKSKEEAVNEMLEYEQKGYKQMFWVEETEKSSEL